jgi:hypothetical protein
MADTTNSLSRAHKTPATGGWLVGVSGEMMCNLEHQVGATALSLYKESLLSV